MSSSSYHHLLIIARGLTKGGVTRALRHIVEEFDLRNDLQVTLLHDDPLFRDTTFSRIQSIYVHSSSKLYFDWVVSLRYVFKLRPTLVLYTKNVIPFTHIITRSQKFTIVYDLGYFEKDLGAYSFLDTLFMKTFMKMSSIWSRKIFTISQFTKDRMIALFGTDPKKIIVTHLALENTFTQGSTSDEIARTRKELSLSEPFIFYAGSISPRKNLQRLLLAFAEVSQTIPHHLYITGIETWGDNSEFAQLVESLKDRVHLLGFVSDEQLKALYTLADVYTFPSLYEGFGLPILEAQSQGTPVLTTNGNSCLEVAGDSAFLVDPTKTDEIREGILTLTQDRPSNEYYRKKGTLNLQRFSWRNCVEKMVQNMLH